jgi:hypothetical protein
MNQLNIKSTLLWGCISAATISFIAGTIFGANKLLNLLMYVTLGAVIVSVILSGALLSGDRLRANYTANAEDRKRRDKFIWKLLLFVSPYAAIAGVIYLIK